MANGVAPPMDTTEIVAQAAGIVGFLLAAYSFQEKNNKRFFIEQGLSGLMFFLNFLLTGAVSAALFNLVNLVRGVLYAKNGKRVWKLVLLEALYTACFVYALVPIIHNGFEIFLSGITYVALVLMTVLMWRGNGKHIRYAQFAFVSPAWIVHNIFHFSLGGILCEVFNMVSVVISFIRYGKNGFDGAEKTK